MTFEEAARLDPDKHPGELDAGRWVPVTKSTWRHGEIVNNVGFLLRLHVRSNPGWRVSVGDPGTKLHHDPDVLRGPDVAVVRSDRRPQGRGVEGWLDGAPDLAVELLGDAQTQTAAVRKALEYLGAGGRVVWLLDPDAQKVLLFTPPDRVRLLAPDDTLDGGEVLPGFACKVAELFE